MFHSNNYNDLRYSGYSSERIPHPVFEVVVPRICRAHIPKSESLHFPFKRPFFRHTFKISYSNGRFSSQSPFKKTHSSKHVDCKDMRQGDFVFFYLSCSYFDYLCCCYVYCTHDYISLFTKNF